METMNLEDGKLVKYVGKKVKFKDKNIFEYIGFVSNYESKIDSGNGICGEIYVDIETSNNPERKKDRDGYF